MCVYVNKKIYIQISMYIYIYIYIYEYMHTCMNICIHVWIYAYMYFSMCARMHAYMYACRSYTTLPPLTIYCITSHYITLHSISEFYCIPKPMQRNTVYLMDTDATVSVHFVWSMSQYRLQVYTIQNQWHYKTIDYMYQCIYPYTPYKHST